MAITVFHSWDGNHGNVQRFFFGPKRIFAALFNLICDCCPVQVCSCWDVL